MVPVGCCVAGRVTAGFAIRWGQSCLNAAWLHDAVLCLKGAPGRWRFHPGEDSASSGAHRPWDAQHPHASKLQAPVLRGGWMGPSCLHLAVQERQEVTAWLQPGSREQEHC